MGVDVFVSVSTVSILLIVFTSHIFILSQQYKVNEYYLKNECRSRCIESLCSLEKKHFWSLAEVLSLTGEERQSYYM